MYNISCSEDVFTSWRLKAAKCKKKNQKQTKKKRTLTKRKKGNKIETTGWLSGTAMISAAVALIAVLCCALPEEQGLSTEECRAAGPSAAPHPFFAR